MIKPDMPFPQERAFTRCFQLMSRVKPLITAVLVGFFTSAPGTSGSPIRSGMEILLEMISKEEVPSMMTSTSSTTRSVFLRAFCSPALVCNKTKRDV